MKNFLEISELRPALSDILPVALGQNGDRLLRIERNIVDVAVEDIAQDDAVFAPGHLAGKAIDAHIVALPEPQLRLDGDHLPPITDLQDPAVIELNQQRDGHQQEVDIGNVWADDERRSADALERLDVITRFEFETQK